MSSNCHVLAKPTGSICNLDCEYCFYLEKEKLYPERKSNWKMSFETLEIFIKQQIEAQDSPIVDLAWQGGEPTLMGVEFYEKAVQVAQKYSKNKKIQFSFQTNGVLLNDQWCQLFKENDFLVGISIDGPELLHDYYRVNRAGKGTFKRVMDGIGLLKKHNIPFNTLTVINDQNVKEPIQVYEFLKSIGSTYMQFIPLVERKATALDESDLVLIYPQQNTPSKVTSWSVKPLEYGQFMTSIFDVWVRKDVGEVFVQMFDSTMSNWCGVPGATCIFQETCGHSLALEANGDLYTCDHYVYPEYQLGNIHTTSIREMHLSNKAISFGKDKKEKLTKQCTTCDYQHLCHGGCPKQRFDSSSAGEDFHNYLCEGYYHFFSQTKPYFLMMRELVMSGRSAPDIIPLLKMRESNITEIRRNSPCPCNSGKRYKQCCAQ